MSTRTKSENVGAALVFGLVAAPFLAVIYGSTLAKLWEWFVADTFGIMAISTAQAIGLSMTLTFVTYQLDAVVPDESDDALRKAVTYFMTAVWRALITLGLAFIVKGFIG